MDPVIASLVTEVIKETESAWGAMMDLDAAVNELKREMSRLQCRNTTARAAIPPKKKKVIAKKKAPTTAREDTAPLPSPSTAYPIVPPFDPTNWFPQKDPPRAVPEPGC